MEGQSPTLKACLSLLQKLPPKDDEKTVKGLKAILASNNDALHELVQNTIEFPLKSAVDEKSGNREFLLCEYNRLGESYRSPFSNNYVPPLGSEDTTQLSDALRNLEIQINEVWDAYRQLYYGKESIGSVYLREVDTSAFRACFLIKKQASDSKLSSGQWNSVHIVHVGKVKDGTSNYKIHSTVWVTMVPSEMTEATWSTRLNKDVEETHKVGENTNASHLENIGKMIESTEIELRSNLGIIYIPKTKEVVGKLRKDPSGSTPSRGMGIPIHGLPMGGPMGAHAAVLGQAVLKRKKNP